MTVYIYCSDETPEGESLPISRLTPHCWFHAGPRINSAKAKMAEIESFRFEFGRKFGKCGVRPQRAGEMHKLPFLREYLAAYDPRARVRHLKLVK